MGEILDWVIAAPIAYALYRVFIVVTALMDASKQAHWDRMYRGLRAPTSTPKKRHPGSDQGAPPEGNTPC